MSEHTPGPWSIDASLFDRDGYDRYIVLGDGLYVAEVIGMATPDKDLLSTANARLIAAAPDLLAACRALQTTESLWGVDRVAFEDALAEACKLACTAIRRAEHGA